MTTLYHDTQTGEQITYQTRIDWPRFDVIQAAIENTFTKPRIEPYWFEKIATYLLEPSVECMSRLKFMIEILDLVQPHKQTRPVMYDMLAIVECILFESGLRGEHPLLTMECTAYQIDVDDRKQLEEYPIQSLYDDETNRGFDRHGATILLCTHCDEGVQAAGIDMYPRYEAESSFLTCYAPPRPAIDVPLLVGTAVVLSEHTWWTVRTPKGRGMFRYLRIKAFWTPKP